MYDGDGELCLKKREPFGSSLFLVVSYLYMNKIIASSANPDKLSATIVGALTALLPIIIAVFQLLGVEVAQEDFMLIIQGIGAMVSTAVMIFGVIRKIILEIKK